MCAPSKLTSYFAAGRPVLAATSPRSAAAHEVNASGGGIVVDPGDPSALREALLSLTSRPSLDALGKRGQAYARERLSEQAALDSYRDWVGELLGAAPVAPLAGRSSNR
jgi:glycosyltransferase involved in cell wall biosynthesis